MNYLLGMAELLALFFSVGAGVAIGHDVVSAWTAIQLGLIAASVGGAVTVIAIVLAAYLGDRGIAPWR